MSSQQCAQKLLKTVSQQRHMFGSILVSCYLYKDAECSFWTNITTLIVPLNKNDPEPKSEKLVYNNIMLLKTTITIDELIQLIEKLSKEPTLKFKIENIDIIIAIRGNRYYRYFTQNNDAFVGINWGFEQYQFYVPIRPREFNHEQLVATDLNFYSDYRHVLKDFIGIDSDRYTDAHGLFFCLPYYGGKIKSAILKTPSLLEINIETMCDTCDDIVGKLSYSNGKKSIQENIVFLNNEKYSKIILKFQPQNIKIALLSKKDNALLDEHNVNLKYNKFKNIKGDLPDVNLLNCIENGEKQHFMNTEIKNFIEQWEKESSEIKNKPIDREGINHIYTRFQNQLCHIETSLTDEEHEKYLDEFKAIEGKLTVALQTARSQYDLTNRGMWTKIVESIANIFTSITGIFKKI